MLVKFGNHPRQVAELTQWDPKNPHWLVIVHGGGWRAPNINHRSSAKMVACVQTHFAQQYGGVLSVSYRLSPEFKHPAHVDDVMAAINLLPAYGVQDVTLLGHSAGGFTAGQAAEQIAKNSELQSQSQSGIRLKRVVHLAGVSNLQRLVQNDPRFAFLVTDAFGRRDWPSVAWSTLPVTDVVVSRGDFAQSPDQAAWLVKETSARQHVLSHGGHDEIFEEDVEWIKNVL